MGKLVMVPGSHPPEAFQRRRGGRILNIRSSQFKPSDFLQTFRQFRQKSTSARSVGIVGTFPLVNFLLPVMCKGGVHHIDRTGLPTRPASKARFLKRYIAALRQFRQSRLCLVCRHPGAAGQRALTRA